MRERLCDFVMNIKTVCICCWGSVRVIKNPPAKAAGGDDFLGGLWGPPWRKSISRYS